MSRHKKNDKTSLRCYHFIQLTIARTIVDFYDVWIKLQFLFIPTTSTDTCTYMECLYTFNPWLISFVRVSEQLIRQSHWFEACCSKVEGNEGMCKSFSLMYSIQVHTPREIELLYRITIFPGSRFNFSIRDLVRTSDFRM